MKKARRNLVRTRDVLMMKVINGATKGGIFKDQKKELDRTMCRREHEQDGWLDGQGVESGGCDLEGYDPLEGAESALSRNVDEWCQKVGCLCRTA